MKLWAAVSLGIILGGGFRVAAHAATSYPVSGSVDGFSGSGTLYASDNGRSDGTYTITGIDSSGVTGLISAGGFHANSNQLRPGASPVLDGGGLAFTATLGDTGFEVDLFGNPDGSYGAHILDSDGVTLDDAATFVLGTPSVTSNALHAAILSGEQATGATEVFSFRFAAEQAVAATPEPGSCALVGTGLLAAATLARRRIRR